jgi:hypothetical protein
LGRKKERKRGWWNWYPPQRWSASCCAWRT